MGIGRVREMLIRAGYRLLVLDPDLQTTDQGPTRAGGPMPCVAVLFVSSSPEQWRHSVRQLVASTTGRIIVGVLYPTDGPFFDSIDERVEWLTVGSICELINRTYRAVDGHILVVDDAITLPLRFLDTALAWVRDDPRIASVSFLSNAADHLSFPTRNLPTPRVPDGFDEQTITDRLRETQPSASPAPILIASGQVVLISSWALGAVGELVAPASARFDVAISDFSARANEKGFVNLVDTSTMVARSSDIAVRPIDDRMREDDMGWLLHRHRWLIGHLDEQRLSGDSPLAHAHQVARVKLEGLTISVDGSCFGPNETGTQVATTRTILALADHLSVRRVVVSMAGQIPSYARQLSAHERIELRSGDSPWSGIVDIGFRPYQPSPGFDVAGWSNTCIRTAVSMLDVIAYANGSYFESPELWRQYRATICEVVSRVDAVTVISADVREQMILHGLPVERGRISVVPLGTTNADPSAPRVCPAGLEQRGFGARRFAVILGVNYHHKNRELAMAAHQELRRRGHDLDLVMAGPAVPYGSTRLNEANQRASLDDAHRWLHVLPQVTVEEKNWLLSHASLAWYPTSAEGFGFMPFESAQFDVPSVSVAFGPLKELSQVSGVRPLRNRTGSFDVPLMAQSWQPSALCDVGEAFLNDPSLAAQHCAAVREAGQHYSWKAHADRLVQLFREILGQPRVRL